MGFLNENNDDVVSQEHNDDVGNADSESLSNSSERYSNSTNFTSKSTSGDSKEELVEIARREQSHVRIIRIVTLAAVIVCAVAVSTLVYYFTNGSDTMNFELEVSSIQLMCNRHGDIFPEMPFNFGLFFCHSTICLYMTSKPLLFGKSSTTLP
jgi:hypothetical protein